MSVEREGFDKSVMEDPANKSGLLGYERTERHYESLRLQAADGSSLEVTRQGAAIHELYLGDRRVLTSAEVDWLGHNKAKHDTSHSVLPFGPNGLQPQHGASRYLDYDIDLATSDRLSMSAYDRLLDVGHSQTTLLDGSGLTTVDEVINLGDTVRLLSFGKHFYFDVPEEGIADMNLWTPNSGRMLTATRPNGQKKQGSLQELHGLLMAGEPLICDDAPDYLRIVMPGGDRLGLQMRAHINGVRQPMQFALWHRPHTDTMCIEPLAGVRIEDDGTFYNDEVILGRHKVLQFETRLNRVT